MGAKVKSEKNSLVLLSSKRTKVDARTRADEAFALPSFVESMPVHENEMLHLEYKEIEMDQSNVEIMKQTMLKHEAMFKEQVHELHRLYKVQRLLMAESREKDLAISKYPAPPSSSNSSSLSSFTTDAMKLVNGRSIWELSPGTFNATRHDDKDFSCKQAHGSPLHDNNLGNMICQEKVNGFLHHVKPTKNAKQRIFDLEHPAEVYMDDEVQEETFQEELVLKTSVLIPGRMPAMDRLEQQNKAHLSLGSGWIRGAVDINERGTCTLKATSSSGEAVTESNSALKHTRCNEEITFFPLSSTRNEGNFQHSSSHPAQFSNKSLLGGLLGLNSESRLDDLSISESQMSNADHEGREEEMRRSLAGERSMQENTKQPHWLCQDSTAVSKIPMVNSIQSPGWFQTLPFSLQKQSMIDMPFASREKGSSVLFQEPSASGNGWSSVGGLQQSPIFNRGTQFKGASGEMMNGAISRPPSWMEDGYSRQHLNGMHMHHHHHLPSTLPSELQPQLPESQLPLQTQLLFQTGMNNGTCRGSLHDFTGRSWYQQNGPLTAIQQQHQSINPAVGFPLPQQGTWPLPTHVGLGGVSQPASLYESHMQGLPNGFNVKSINTVSEPAVYVNIPLPFVSTSSKLEGPSKQVYDPCFLDARADTELSLGPSSAKLMRKKGEDSDSSETQARGILATSLQTKASGEVKWGDNTMKKFHSQEMHSGKNQSIVSNIFGLQTPCVGDMGAKENSNVLAQEGGCTITGNEGDAVSTSTITVPEKDLKVATNESTQRAPFNLEFTGKEFGSTIVKDEKHGVSKHNKPEKNASDGHKPGDNDAKLSPQHFHTVHKEQMSLQMPQNGYSLPDHSHGKNSTSESDIPCSGDEESNNNGIEINLDCETDKSINVNSTCFIMTDACVEALCNKAGTVNMEQERSGAFLGQELGNISSQNSLDANLTEIMLQERKNITEESAEADLSVVQKVQFTSKDAEPSNLAHSHVTVESPKTCVSLNCIDHEQDSTYDIDYTNEAADILLSLGSNLVSEVEEVGNYVAYTPELSSGWFANVTPEEDEDLAAGVVQAPIGDVKSSDILTSKFATHCKALRCREDVASLSEPDIEDEYDEVCLPENVVFFKIVTIMLKASGITTDEQSQDEVEQKEEAGEELSVSMQEGRTITRGRVGGGKEMLPNIASLSQQEVTEDLQTIGGLMKSTTKVVMRTSGILCRENARTGECSISSAAGTRGNGSSDFKKALRDKQQKHSFDGFPVSSWGDATRRRRMRRHRSRWSVLASGRAAAWEEPLRSPLA